MLLTTLLSILATLVLASAGGDHGHGHDHDHDHHSKPSKPGPSPSPKPPQTGTVINPNGDTKKCLDVRGAKFTNGTPVQIWDCNGTPAQSWMINRGKGIIMTRHKGRSFCLDAGTDPKNGVRMKIWECQDGAPEQQWFYTVDNRVHLAHQGFCLDLTDGDKTKGNEVQIWKCKVDNPNQLWTTGKQVRPRSGRFADNLG